MARVTAMLQSVGINALFLDPGRSGGPETYMRELVSALVDEAPNTRFTVVTTRRGAAGLARDGWTERVELVSLPADEGERLRRQVAEQLLLPRLACRRDFDVLHSLASVAPIVARVPHAITLHDVTFFKRRTFDPITTFGMRTIVSQASRRADALLTGSLAARDEICEVLGFAPDRFDVVPHGLGRARAVAAEDQAAVRERHGLDGDRLVVCVAAKRPHKNQEVLVRAAPLLGQRTDVVLAGHPEAYDAELRRIAAEVGATRVRFVDYVPDAELEALWELADCAVFPTLAEGFGLPVVEAMACGTPVVAAPEPALREVAGDAAVFADDLADGVRRALAERERLSAAGLERAKAFSWRETARITADVYRRILAA